MGLTEELRHSKCILYRKIPRIDYISILPAKLINIPKNLVVMSWKWCSNVIPTVPLANATDTVTLSWQWLDAFVALSCVKSMAGIMIVDSMDYSQVQKLVVWVRREPYPAGLTNLYYEKPNESTQHSQWNIKWKHTALIMKEAMNKCNLMNEIFIEIAQG